MKANSPKDFATLIVNSFPTHVILSKVEVAGPGFINIYMSREWLCAQLQEIIMKNEVSPPDVGPKKKVIIDYSSPNIAKDMHVGHLRSTIIGDTFGRILEFCGHEVERVNHVGDWGTQFGMLIAYLKDEFPDFKHNPPNIKDLTVFYKVFAFFCFFLRNDGHVWEYIPLIFSYTFLKFYLLSRLRRKDSMLMKSSRLELITRLLLCRLEMQLTWNYGKLCAVSVKQCF